MAIEREHVYVIPSGVYLAADDDGALRLSRPLGRHGARLPFDFLLKSFAHAFGTRAICVVLSGVGADGSAGLKAIMAKGGLVIAQDASEADHDGMPRSAIATGAADYILSAAGIAAVLVERKRGEIIAPAPEQTSSLRSVQDLLAAIVDLLRGKTAHDFTFHKHGTLERGVERRMAMAAINSPNAYLEFLRHDPEEFDQLARDLLIDVTGFFRDSPVFDFLAKDVIPDLVRYHAEDRPLRIWSAACSSVEETYSPPGSGGTQDDCAEPSRGVAVGLLRRGADRGGRRRRRRFDDRDSSRWRGRA
jgi:two-component system CheB/CheR fusion protein